MEKGLVIGGSFSEVLVREKSNQRLELGELLIANTPKGKVLLQVVDLFFGSQISQQNLELVSGMKLEEQTSIEFMDPHLRNYTLGSLKSVLMIAEGKTQSCKVLPGFFSSITQVSKEDLNFLTKPNYPLFIGDLRSGSKTLDLPIFLQGKEVLSHHVLIGAATGKGKSNLTSVMLWQATQQDYCGLLVLDPHDEYYGRSQLGLKDHPQKEKVAYFTSNNPPPGARSLSINLELIKPEHFNGVVQWTHAQQDALSAYYRQYGDNWIQSLFLQPKLETLHESTVMVLKRKMMNLLQLDVKDEQIYTKGIFSLNAGSQTINDIVKELEEAKTVVIDTSRFQGAQEILIGSLVATQVLKKYQYYKTQGTLNNKPVISIVLEEAPRVLGKEVLEKGSNIFSTIAREGRKFQVGLVAITQLPSLIPRQILANMNTKIILGIEMKQERQAIIESAAQDLSRDDRTIASLDKGEALITSNFARFATPVKVPFFPSYVKGQRQTHQESHQPKRAFTGMQNIQ